LAGPSERRQQLIHNALISLQRDRDLPRMAQSTAPFLVSMFTLGDMTTPTQRELRHDRITS
jgi:hypothetical protein